MQEEYLVHTEWEKIKCANRIIFTAVNIKLWLKIKKYIQLSPMILKSLTLKPPFATRAWLHRTSGDRCLAPGCWHQGAGIRPLCERGLSGLGLFVWHIPRVLDWIEIWEFGGWVGGFAWHGAWVFWHIFKMGSVNFFQQRVLHWLFCWIRLYSYRCK